MGGCGKSQLALEYCQQSENEKSYSSIFWIDAMTPSTVEQSFTFLAQKLSVPGFDIGEYRSKHPIRSREIEYIARTLAACF
jgi:hypothetical protein